MKHLAVIGSRTFDDATLLAQILTPKMPFVLVSGGARGADKLAENFAAQNGLEKLIFPAQWKLYGKGAGYIRNKTIIDHADEVIAFWDGESRGTLHALDYANDLRKPFQIINFHAQQKEQ